MEVIDGLLAFALFALLGGWPVFLFFAVASVVAEVSLRRFSKLAARSYVRIVIISFFTSFLTTLVVWEFWPVSFGSPMWNGEPIPILGPAVVALSIVAVLTAVNFLLRHRAQQTAQTTTRPKGRAV